MEDIIKCDVVNKELLAMFRYYRNKWNNILNGKGVHSIFNQIQDLLWVDTVYRTYNESRRISLEVETPKISLPGVFVDFVDLCYFNSQIMAIRRLVDESQSGHGREVYSIPRLVAEIEANVHLITRENYVCFDGIPYDHATGDWRRDADQKYRQEKFDKLSRTGPDNRKRTDEIDPIIFADIRKLLQKIGLVKEYANKFVAHSSDPSNRRAIEAKFKEITLAYFDEVYEAIIKAGKMISLLIGEYLPTELAIAPFDQLAHWENPMISKTNKELLYQFWRERQDLFMKLDRYEYDGN